MLKISIPNPCHEDWNKMSPAETGRHCSSCAKTVVDFTSMSDEQVKNFFVSKKEERVCGRFKQTQLQQIIIDLPQNIFSIEMPLWKKFLTACLVVFSTTLFSCDTKIERQHIKIEKVSKPDKASNGFVGMLDVKWDSVPVPIETCFTTMGNTIPEIIIDTTVEEVTGDIDFKPVDSIKSKQIDSAITEKVMIETFITGDTILIMSPIKNLKNDSTTKSNKLKNPQKADSADCNTMKYY